MKKSNFNKVSELKNKSRNEFKNMNTSPKIFRDKSKYSRKLKHKSLEV